MPQFWSRTEQGHRIDEWNTQILQEERIDRHCFQCLCSYQVEDRGNIRKKLGWIRTGICLQAALAREERKVQSFLLEELYGRPNRSQLWQHDQNEWEIASQRVSKQWSNWQSLSLSQLSLSPYGKAREVPSVYDRKLPHWSSPNLCQNRQIRCRQHHPNLRKKQSRQVLPANHLTKNGLCLLIRYWNISIQSFLHLVGRFLFSLHRNAVLLEDIAWTRKDHLGLHLNLQELLEVSLSHSQRNLIADHHLSQLYCCSPDQPAKLSR